MGATNAVKLSKSIVLIDSSLMHVVGVIFDFVQATLYLGTELELIGRTMSSVMPAVLLVDLREGKETG